MPQLLTYILLPKQYDGAKAIERAYDDNHEGKLKDNTTGIMIHYVISEVDRGQPIIVKEIQSKTRNVRGIEG